MFNALVGERWRKDGHIPESLLVAYLDGEVSARQAAAIQAHLSSCWSCRARRQKTETAIAGFVDYQESWQAAAAAQPPGRWAAFETRLDRLAAAASRRPLAERVAARLRTVWAPRLAWKFVCAALVVAGLIVWHASRTVPAVSAMDVLDKAGTAEQTRLRRVARPVVYQRIAVQRMGARPRTGTLEIWTDPGRGRVRRRGEEQLWSDLERIYRLNQIPAARPLSIEVFRSWRLGIRPAAEEVLPAAATVTVRTRAAGPAVLDRIVSGEIVVRRSDWHPVKQSWHVQAPGGLEQYELTEMDFAVTALDTAPPELFAAPPQIAAAPAPAAPPAALARPAAEPVPPVPAAELDQAEIDARYVLHERGECLAGTVQIVRERPDRITIRGTGDTAARTNQLGAALAGIPFVEFRVKALDGTGELPAPAPATGQPRRASSPEWVTLADAAVSFSQSVRKQGWALDRLARRYGGPEAPGLSADARRKLETMLRDHLAGLRGLLAAESPRLRRALHGLAPAGAPPAAQPAAAPDAGWAPLCLAIARAAERLDDAAQRAFASGDTAEADARAVLDWLTALETQLPGAEARLAAAR